MKLPRILFLLLLLIPALAGTVPAPEEAPPLPSVPGSASEPSLQPPAAEPGQTPPDLLLEGEPFRPLPQAERPLPKPEPPKPGEVDVKLVGGTSFKTEEIRAAIADTLKDIGSQGLSNALADDAAFYLANFYREHGYSHADVAWELPGRNQLRLKITEGPLNRLGSLRVTGNRKISQPTLLDYLLGPTHERFPREKDHPPFVEADIESGVEWAQAYYIEKGFLDSVVEPPKYVDLGNGVVDVQISVKEGIRYTFGELSFSGKPIFSREELLQVVEKARSKASPESEADRRQPKPDRRLPEPLAFSTQEVGRLQQALEYYFKTKGYFNAAVETISNPAAAVNGRVAVDFQIQPGDQYRFDSLTVAGLNKLKPDFLPNRFKKLAGQIYNPEKVQQKEQEMTQTGLFKSFRVNEEPLEDDTVRLDLTVEESKAKEVGFLLGYTTLEGGIVGASYRDRNLFGEGRPLTANAQYSTKGLRGEVLYSDPWFLKDSLILRLRLYALTRQYDGYSKQEEGMRAELARKIKLPGPPGSEELEVSAFVQGRHVDLQDVLIEPETDALVAHLKGEERARRRQQAREDLIGPTSYTIDSFGLSTNYDTRDSKINPTRGLYVNTTLDSASPVLGSQISFTRATVAGSYYLTLGKKGLLALGARAGIINPFKERGSIPIDERFFNGGSLSVRSFVERHLGPKDRNGFPVGGDSFTVFNAEFDHPIHGDLAGAAFLDAGSLSQGNGFGQMRYGVGVGLRYRLPIGPLRLDYGFNPTRKADESVGAFHFSFGFAF